MGGKSSGVLAKRSSAFSSSALALLCIALLLSALAGCGSDDTPIPTPTPTPTPTPSPVGPPATAPALSCPVDMQAQSRDGKAVLVTYTAPATVGGVAPIAVACSPKSG